MTSSSSTYMTNSTTSDSFVVLSVYYLMAPFIFSLENLIIFCMTKKLHSLMSIHTYICWPMRTTALDFLCSKPCYHTCDRLISALCLIYVGMIILAWINNLCINRDHFPQSRFPSYTTSLSCLWHIHMDNISHLCLYTCDNYTCTLPVKYRDNLSHSRLSTMPSRHTYTSRQWVQFCCVRCPHCATSC